MIEKCERILKQGIPEWNKWRKLNPEIMPSLSGIDLSNRNFIGANFSGVDFFRTNLDGSCLQAANLSDAKLERAELVDSDLKGANLDGANLYQANCSGANFSNASFDSANLKQINLSGAKLCGANLINADLFEANLINADLSRANLTSVRFVQANVQDSNLEGCRVYGVSVWNIKGTPANQNNLIVTPKLVNRSNLVATPEDESELTIDGFEVAQFVYLLLDNEKIRNVIDTVVKKGVLILGRFTPDRLNVLEEIKSELRRLGYLPILFNFLKPDNHSFIETVLTVAKFSRFIIADFTDSKAVLEELPLIMQNHSIPLQPLIMKGSGKAPSTLYNLRVQHRDKILETFPYADANELVTSFKEKIIDPLEEKAGEITETKRVEHEKRNSEIY